MAREKEKYFGKPKKKHTKIKHNICCETLKYSVYIANIISKKINKRQKYIYIDLFAGAGKFEDKSKGSIILALDILSRHLENNTIGNWLSFEVIGIEKDLTTFKQLGDSIKSYKNSIDISIKNSDWEDFKDDIKNKLKNTKWGFIFADPFATELDLKKFLELVEVSNMQDFLIFLNINKVLRDLGKTNISNKEKERIKNSLKKFLILNDEEISELEIDRNDKEAIRNLIVKKLSGYKDFVIGITIPVEAKEKMYHGDFYSLVLLTNSVSVVDKYLETYHKQLKVYTNTSKPLWNLGLDEEFNSMPNQFSFFDFWNRLVNKFLSWKDLKNLADEVPTTENIRQFLNRKFKERKVKFLADKRFIYSRKAQHGEKGMLKKDILKSKKDLENVIVVKQKHL